MLVKDRVVQRHLVDMYTFLNPEFGLSISDVARASVVGRTYDENIISCVEDIGNSGLAYDGSVSLRQVVYQHTQV